MPGEPVPEDVSNEVADLFRPAAYGLSGPDWVGHVGSTAPLTVGELLVAAALELVGTEYVRGGGHGALVWRPPFLDCSGLVRVVWWHVTGTDLLDGSSEAQWANSLGGRVPDDEPLQPGDVIFSVGSPIDPSPGHVGYVVTYDHITGLGTFISAYDTAEDTLVKPFDRFDGQGPLKVVGALRVANAAHVSPPPPAPAPTLPVVDQFITSNPHGDGDYLCSWSTRRAVGIPSPAIEAQIQTTKVERHNINGATFAYFVPEVWAAVPAK